MINKVHSIVKYLIGKIVVYCMLLVFPIVVHDRFRDLTITRYRIFLYLVIVCFTIMCINEVVFDIYNHKFIQLFRRIHIYTVISLFFAVAAIASYMLSPYKKYALTGTGVRYIGLIFMLAIACLYVMVSFCYQFNGKDIITGLSVAFLINVLAIINFLGIDPLGFFIDMKQNSIPAFISTMGNINVYGAYTVLMTCISVYLFIVAEKKAIRFLYLLYSIAGVMGIVVSNSDSACLGLITFLIIVPILSIHNWKQVKDYIVVIAMVCFSTKLLKLLMMIRGIQVRELHSIMELLVYQDVYYIIVFVLVVIVAYMNYTEKTENIAFSKKSLSRFHCIYISIVVVALFTVLASILYYSVFYKTSDIGIAANYLRFNDKWGSERGYIWKNLIGGYRNFPILYKIFGTGEATVSCILSDYSSTHWNLLHGVLIDNAHNILLHFLVTTGLTGCIAYLAMVLYAIRSTINVSKRIEHISNQKDAQMVIAIGIGIIAYFVQGEFNILETITFPIFVCMMGIINAYKNNG